MEFYELIVNATRGEICNVYMEPCLWPESDGRREGISFNVPRGSLPP